MEPLVIAEIIYPGVFLEWKNPDDERLIESILRNMMSQLNDANLAFLFFEDARAVQHEARISGSLTTHDPVSDPSLWDLTDEERLQVQLQKDAERKRALWAQGQLPEEYLHSLSFMNARSFVIALHLFDKFLGQLVKIEDVPPIIRDTRNRFKKEFPFLTGVRDSDQHMDERARGKAFGSPLRVDPEKSTNLGLPVGAILVGALRGNMYATTTREGVTGHIAVSDESLRIVQECLQACINAFTWTGPPSHHPR